ncbi:hypothetical protein SH1V18_29020 [Vallitalea longa]|uniref:HTH arsR-type domain-containing protein n=1 Tax=Vallitalea longa TaxID=2936439 RepID=A0A9W6DGD1_9FIRM|nr:winged helix-turn-helix domain-containing protein [Vallitalea longa]GKX30422.1 hypothetical protein SH1V18_29020 [Vallitalea longa]
MESKIKYNIVADFMLSILRIVGEGDTHEYTDRFKLNPDIVDYVKNIKENMCPILGRDLKYFFKNFCKGVYAIIYYAIDEEINDIEKVLDNITNMTKEEFLNIFINKLDMEIPENVSDKELKKIIEEELKNDINDSDKVDIYMDYFRYPEQMKERLIFTLGQYYNQFFIKIEDKVKDFMDKKLQKHRQLLKEDKDKFFDTIVMLIDKDIVNNQKVDFFICYFNEIGLGLRFCDDKDIYTIIYGYGLEQKFDDNMKKMEYKELIKLLNDDNRFEIMSLLGKRAWYSKELADKLGITTATMSYHIKKISTLGILDIETGKNKRLYYRLNKNKLIKIVNNMLFEIIDA